MTDALDTLTRMFTAQQARGAFPGGQLVVMHEGRVVCDVAVGVARGYRGESAAIAVTPETRFQVMSASKPFVGFAVALLDDAGELDVDAPVARYFPEFGKNGKDAITVNDVLVHRSGVLLETLSDHSEWWSDWDAVVRAMADAQPRFPRGTLAYSPTGFGWILAEVVQRITRQSLQEFLLSRLPAALSGIRFVDASQAGSVAHSYWLGPPELVLAGHNIVADFERVNNELTCVSAVVPGAGLLANARELAAFYDLLVSGGREVISERTLAKYTTEQTSGVEKQLRVPVRLGRGFALGSFWPHPYGWWSTQQCFGHAGGFGVVAFGDPRWHTAVAIVTNGHRGVWDMLRRFAPLGCKTRKLARAARPAASALASR